MKTTITCILKTIRNELTVDLRDLNFGLQAPELMKDLEHGRA